MHLVIYTDGGARGNPGPAGIGIVIYRVENQEIQSPSRRRLDLHKLKLIEKFGRYIGEATNNQAEYQALLAALKRAHELKAQEVDCMMDSELAVKQLNREYKVRNRELAPLFVKVWNETTHFKAVRFHHIPREKNKEADQMVNEAIDKMGMAIPRR